MKKNLNYHDGLSASQEQDAMTHEQLLRESKEILELLSGEFSHEELSKIEQAEIEAIRGRLEDLIKGIEQNNIIPEGYEEILAQAKATLWAETLEEIKEKYHNDPEKLQAIDALQAALDVVGFEPTYGTFADAGNALIYLFRTVKAGLKGEWALAKQHVLDAGISAISIVPFADVIKILRLRKVPKLAKAAIKGARGAKSYAKKEKTKRINEVKDKLVA